MLALDARLAGVVRSAREPMLAQLRLAWWRDRLNEDRANWPKGEPLLAQLRTWDRPASALVALVDGWEALLGEPPLGQAAFEQFAHGRAAALSALANELGEAEAGPMEAARQWALADLALHLADPEERAMARDLIGAQALPRSSAAMRPLAVLAGLNLRAVRRGRADPLDGPGALIAAIRLGIAGR